MSDDIWKKARCFIAAIMIELFSLCYGNFPRDFWENNGAFHTFIKRRHQIIVFKKMQSLLLELFEFKIPGSTWKLLEILGLILKLFKKILQGTRN